MEMIVKEEEDEVWSWEICLANLALGSESSSSTALQMEGTTRSPYPSISKEEVATLLNALVAS